MRMKRILLSVFTLCTVSNSLNAVDFVSITTPANNSTVSGQPLVITGTSSQPDLNVRLTIDTTIIGTVPTDSNGDWNFQVDGLSNGDYTLTADLITGSFEILATTQNDFTVHNPETIFINNPVEDEIVFLNPSIIDGSTSLPFGVIDISLDSNFITTVTADEFGAWAATYTLTSNGAHTLTALLTQDNQPSASVNIIGAVPVLNVLSGSNTSTTSDGITVTVNLIDNPSVSGTITAGNGLTISGGTTRISTLGAGIVNTNSSGVISSAATTNHAVLVGNAAGLISSLTTATNGQLLVGATSADPAFATLTSGNGTVQFTSGANSLALNSVPTFGNIIRVDSVLGNDSTGNRNTQPFLTISAALSAAQSGDVVLVLPGTYSESFTIPSGVAVRGVNAKAVTISKSVSSGTDLVTMGENSTLENVTLSLTSSSHVQLRGIVFPGTTSATAQVNNVTLTVDNSGAGAGTSNVYGINSTGTGSPAPETYAVRNSAIFVRSAGLGSKRGILVNAANRMNVSSTGVSVTNSGGGSSIALEANHTSALLYARSSSANGGTADISQTAGTLVVSKTILINGTANSLGFGTEDTCANIVWANPGTRGLGGTSFMPIGTNAVGSETFFYVTKPLVVKSLAIKARVAPGGALTDTWTLRKNGIDQAMTITLTGSQTANTNTTTSISYTTGDTISLKWVGALGSNTSEPAVVMELY